MIIGISGKMGNGKDTVGEIIQYIDSKSTKTFDEWRKEKIHPSGYDIGDKSVYEINDESWQIKKFAGKLKQIASIITGIPLMKFEDQSFKNTLLPSEWDTYSIVRKGYSRKMQTSIEPFQEDSIWLKNGNSVIHDQMTVRTFLQKLGTDALRDNLHPNVWVNALFSDYTENQKWIITDVRFENEAQSVLDRSGFLIRVNRPTELKFPELWKQFNEQKIYNEWEEFLISINEYRNVYPSHASEIALDNFNFDYVINNDGSIDSLIEKVREIMNKINQVNFVET